MPHFIRKIYTKLRYGVSCCERSDADYYLSKHIYKVLIEFKKHNIGHPTELTEKEWDEILDKMIWSFGFYPNAEPEFDELEQEGIDFFAKYFKHLWS